MPTHYESGAFQRDYERLTRVQQARFKEALRRFVTDLLMMEAGRLGWFRPGLRVGKLSGRANLYEMTWAPDGRATFSWGEPVMEGRRHIVWLRCGGHGMLGW